MPIETPCEIVGIPCRHSGKMLYVGSVGEGQQDEFVSTFRVFSKGVLCVISYHHEDLGSLQRWLTLYDVDVTAGGVILGGEIQLLQNEMPVLFPCFWEAVTRTEISNRSEDLDSGTGSTRPGLPDGRLRSVTGLGVRG
jgi:hypothetical protein